MFVEELDKYMDSKRKLYPCRSNRASSMGHPCDRYLYYCRKNWEDKGLPSLDLQYIFDLGNEHEKIFIRRMLDSGVEITHQQQNYEMPKYDITGHIDGKVRNGDFFPFDAKSMHDYIWNSIHCLDDMKNHSSAHVRTYPGQLQLYLLMGEHEKGLFFLINKQSSKVKEIWVDLDLEYCEQLLQKAERVNAAIEIGEPPERMQYDPSNCNRCPFAHLCLPATENNDDVLMEFSDEIASKLDRRDELYEQSREYDKLDKEVKDWCKSVSKSMILCGDWCIIKKESKNGSIRCNISRLGEEDEA